MKHPILIGTAMGLLLILTSCGSGGPDAGELFEGEVNTYEGVTMSVVDGTATPGGVTVNVRNSSSAEIDSGNAWDFFVQVEQDGQWYALETLQDKYANTAEAYVYETDVPRELELSWSRFYGSLEPGRYRVCKWFSEYRAPGDDTDFLLAAEFTLE